VVDSVVINLGCIQDNNGWHVPQNSIVLLAGEAFLLSRRDDDTILDEGSRVTVESGEAEQSHATSSCLLLRTPCR
jgi:hypothetical protein